MKKFYIILISVILLSGCATYKVEKSRLSSEGGFVVSRYDKVIPEYTIGVDNSLPDKEKAEARFKRRRAEVEYYYKQMGFIENRFKQVFVGPPLTLVQLVTGIFRIPFIAVSDYKYNHNPQYKAKVDKLEDERYDAERAKVKGLKDKLSEYIKEDLNKESPLGVSELAKPKDEVQVAALEENLQEVPAVTPAIVEPEAKPVLAPAEPEVKPESALVEPVVKPVEIIKPEVQEKAMAVQEDLKLIPPVVEEPKVQESKPEIVLPNPTAVIIAKPQNGESPLKVNFTGRKSSSPNGKIVAYSWDFGDGDKSNKPNPSNTYWSATYGTREFMVTLTVTDNKGMTSSTSTTIQVINK